MYCHVFQKPADQIMIKQSVIGLTLKKSIEVLKLILSAKVDSPAFMLVLPLASKRRGSTDRYPLWLLHTHTQPHSKKKKKNILLSTQLKQSVFTISEHSSQSVICLTVKRQQDCICCRKTQQLNIIKDKRQAALSAGVGKVITS